MTQFRREEAVSPVIGVILMVAITVILAAVIAAFVFGMASGISKTKSVAATARQNGINIIITWQGGADNALVAGWNATITNSTGYTSSVLAMPNTVGNSSIVTGIGTSGLDHVTVVAVFSDGTSQVVLDTYV